MAVYKDLRIKVDPRPTRWSAVQLRPVPLQEGEVIEGVVEVVKEDPDKKAAIVKDPLGLNGTNLVDIQLLYNEGKKLTNAANVAAAKKGRKKGGKEAGEHTWLADVIQQDKRKKRFDDDDGGGINGEMVEEFSDEDDTDYDEDDEDNDDDSVVGDDNPNDDEVRDSILPTDKRFNPTLFLFLLHPGATKQQLEKGLQNLDLVLNKQTKDRENIVRAHLGLFIHCADEIEKLRDAMTNFSYHSTQQQNISDQSQYDTNDYNTQLDQLLQQSEEFEGNAKGASLSDTLNRAKFYLEIAKNEIQKTLTPTLERIALNRKLRVQEKVLQKLASQNNILDSSTKLREYLKNKDLHRFVEEYLKVQQTDALSKIESGIASPTTTTNNTTENSSIDILKQVKDGASARAAEAIAYCTKMITSPCSSFSDVLYHCDIILRLSTVDMYYESLEQAYTSQIIHFQEEVKIILYSYYSEVDRISGISSEILSYQESTSDLTPKEMYIQSGGKFTVSLQSLSSSNPLFNPLISVDRVKDMNPFMEVSTSISSNNQGINIDKSKSKMNSNTKNNNFDANGNKITGELFDLSTLPVDRQLLNNINQSEQLLSRTSRTMIKKFQNRWNSNVGSDISQYDVSDGLTRSPLLLKSMKNDDEKDNICTDILFELRVTFIAKLVEKFSKWIPSLVRLVGYLSTIEGLNSSKPNQAARELASKKSNLKPLTDIISFCSDRLVEALNGINVSPNKLATKFKDPILLGGTTTDVISFGKQQSVITIGNKEKDTVNILATLFSMIKTVESRVTMKDSPTSKQLQEPFYSKILEIVTKLYVSMYSFLDTYDIDEFSSEIPPVVKEALSSRETNRYTALDVVEESNPRASVRFKIPLNFNQLSDIAEDSNPRASVRFKNPPSLNQLNDAVDTTSKRQKRQKALLGSIINMQGLAKQYFMAHADVSMERLSIFLQEEWALVTSQTSHSNTYRSSTRISAGYGKSNSSGSRNLSMVIESSQGHLGQLSDLEFAINDSYFLLQQVITDMSVQTQKHDWIVDVVLKGIMKVNSHTITLLMRQLMAYDDDMQIHNIFTSLGRDVDNDYQSNPEGDHDDDNDSGINQSNNQNKKSIDVKQQQLLNLSKQTNGAFSDPKVVANDIENIFAVFDTSTSNTTGKSNGISQSSYISGMNVGSIGMNANIGSTNLQDQESMMYIFPILRICVLLRNYWFPKLWLSFQNKFYSIRKGAQSVTDLSFTSNSRPDMKVTSVEQSRVGGADASLSTANTGGKFTYLKSDSSIYLEYISRPLVISSLLRNWVSTNADLLYDSVMTEKLRDLIMIEEPLIRKYVLLKLETIRKIVSASFTCFIQEEKIIPSLTRESSLPINSLPSQVSRILLLLGNEKSTLTKCLRKTGLFPKDTGKQKTVQSITVPVTPVGIASSTSAVKRRGSQVQRRNSSTNRSATVDPSSTATNAAVTSLNNIEDGDLNPTSSDSNLVSASAGINKASTTDNNNNNDANAATDDATNPLLAFLSDQQESRHAHKTATDDNFISKSEGPLLYKVSFCQRKLTLKCIFL